MFPCNLLELSDFNAGIDTSGASNRLVGISGSNDLKTNGHIDCKCYGVDTNMILLAALATVAVFLQNTISLGAGRRRRKRRNYKGEYATELLPKGAWLITV